jgi:lysophospholipase L1-like esterase
MQTMPMINISRHKLFIIIFIPIICGLIGTIDIFQPVLNLLINKKIIFWNQFLIEDSNFGWRNKPGANWTFPPEGEELAIFFNENGEINSEIKKRGENIVKIFSNPNYYRVSYHIDEEGNRLGYAYSPAQLKITKKTIWIIGDSSAFGYGVTGNKTFSFLLQEKLASEGIVIKNFSVIGYDLRQLRKLIQLHLKTEDKKPDLIIFWGGFNHTPKARVGLWKWAPVREITHLSYKYQMWRIRRICKEAQIKLLLTTLPSFQNFSELNRINGYLKSFTKNQYLDVVDIAKVFKENNKRELYAPIDDIFDIKIHPSELGQMIAFEQYLKKLN